MTPGPTAPPSAKLDGLGQKAPFWGAPGNVRLRGGGSGMCVGGGTGTAPVPASHGSLRCSAVTLNAGLSSVTHRAHSPSEPPEGLCGVLGGSYSQSRGADNGGPALAGSYFPVP